MVIEELSLTQFVEKLAEPGWSFARYGDGTFLCLQGSKGINCDGASLSSVQAEGLEESLRDETIAHGIGDLALTTGRAEEWLAKKRLNIHWYECNVMNTASHQGRLLPFVRWLRDRKVIMVGPKHLERFKGFPRTEFVEVHPTDAYRYLDHTVNMVCRYLAQGRGNTVLISAGPSAPTMVSRIHCTFPLANVIDTGSVWDPYVGVYSRKVHRRMGPDYIRNLGKVNFRQDIAEW